MGGLTRRFEGPAHVAHSNGSLRAWVNWEANGPRRQWSPLQSNKLLHSDILTSTSLNMGQILKRIRQIARELTPVLCVANELEK